MSYKQKAPVIVSEGGTSLQTITANSLITGNNTSALQPLSTGTSGYILTSQGSALPTWTSPSSYGVSSVNSQTGAVTISGGSTGASYSGSGGTVTMSFSGITANAGTVNIGSDSTDNAVNIATAASSGRTTTIGNTTGTSSLSLPYGSSGSYSLASASGNVLTMSSSGYVNCPLQPAFLVVLTSTESNITGDGTEATVHWSTYGSEIFDQSGSFSSSTFTAPTAGKYKFCIGMEISGLTSSFTDAYIKLVTDNRSFILSRINPTTLYYDSAIVLTASCITDMDASDTAVVKVCVSGGTATVDFYGQSTSDVRSYFAGYLKC